MFAKLVNYSELSKLLSMKSKASVDFIPIRLFWSSWVARVRPMSLLDHRWGCFHGPFEYDEWKSHCLRGLL